MLVQREGWPMRQLDDLLMTYLAAAVMVSPFAGLEHLLAPLEAHRLAWVFAVSGSGTLWG
ncbi:hypothetical protein AUC69_12250 [Methyloceanibacter superfactus]|uniref:Uncharacterized protein n=2 Tax=Methyloceanibacter superfactus TaxID=1774969 RepID=A0A1E3VV01_9HYPH|nr:hypothetical protein AUC69_12250 [Methyloceanibacter superfactus]